MATVQPRKPADAAFLKALIHSPAGHGKTHLLGTAQEDERTFPMAFLNWESGEATLSGLDIDVFDIRSSADFDLVYKDLSRSDSPYKSVGVDSITEAQIGMLLEILELDGARTDPDLLAQQDWGIILTRMRRTLRRFVKMLPMHCFMTALSKDDVVARVGSVKAPAVQGSFAHELPGLLDVVGYLALETDKESEETERILLLHDNPKFSVKARTPWNTTVPSEITDPSVSNLLDALGF